MYSGIKNASDKYSYLVLEQGGLDVALGIYDGFNPDEEPCIDCWEINTAVDEKAICNELHDLCFIISAYELVERRLFWIRQEIRNNDECDPQEWMQKWLQEEHQELCEVIAQHGISTDELPKFTRENHDALKAYEEAMHEKLRVELRKVQPIVDRHNEPAARLGIIKRAYYYVRNTHKSIRDAYILRKYNKARRLSSFNHC